MAFESFRTQAAKRPRSRWRIVIYTGSVLVHVVLISAGVAYSFWHVDELSPPRLKLTFMSAAPPPPPPPPPPGGAGGPKKKIPKVRPIEPKPTALVQPKDTPKQQEPPKEEPKAGDGEKGGEKGGTIGGTVGGTIGGTIGGKPGGTVGGTGGAVTPKTVAPHMGEQQFLSGDKPDFPLRLRKANEILRVTAKICVTTDGAVDKVTIIKGVDPELDDGVVAKVKKWRFRPWMANNTPVPFCYVAGFDFKPIN